MKKRINFLSFGTTGDVLPFISLATKLKEFGYEVCITAGTNYEKLIKENNIEYAPISVDINELMNSKEIQSLLSKNPIKKYKSIKEIIIPILKQTFTDSLEASKGSNLIIFHPKVTSAVSIAEKLNIKCLMASPIPIYAPTREFPFLSVKAKTLGPFNKLSHYFINIMSSFFTSYINNWRKEALDLPPLGLFDDRLLLRGKKIPLLFGYSSYVLPRPSDWKENIHVTGYWFVDQQKNWQPPDELESFINNGSPPIYIGFGSMVGKDPERLTSEIVKALNTTKYKCILTTGWGALKNIDVPENVFVTDYVPHDWLMQHVSAVVHHGGAGTTAAGLRYGKPTLICPFMVDQTFWGNVVCKQGLGPEPISQEKITSEKFANALKVLISDNTLKLNAQKTGEKIRNENGTQVAVELINKFIE
ncbi:MAG: glycosyltransferase [Cyanobacteriota bacterium]